MKIIYYYENNGTDSKMSGSRTEPRKPYRAPNLIELGDLRTLTLGGSPGAGDSGSGGLTQQEKVGGMPLFDPYTGEVNDFEEPSFP